MPLSLNLKQCRHEFDTSVVVKERERGLIACLIIVAPAYELCMSCSINLVWSLKDSGRWGKDPSSYRRHPCTSEHSAALKVRNSLLMGQGLSEDIVSILDRFELS